MKTQNLKYVALVLSLLFSAVSLNAMAQEDQENESRQGPRKHWRSHRGSGDGEFRIFNIPGLTDQQKEQIKKIRLQAQKEALPVRNEVHEKRARLNTLRTTEKADLNEINKVVEDIGSLQTQLMKNREMTRQQVRNLLNEEQRLFFDSQRHGSRHVKHRRHGSM